MNAKTTKGSWYKWEVLLLLWMAYLLNQADRQVFNTVLPAIRDALTNPVEVIGDEKGWVKAVKCIRMELGEPDESGRRSPVEVPGSEFEIETDTVIMSLGTSPNPLIAKTTAGLETNRRGCLVADENGATTRPGVFAGGDTVTGAATVILAMGAGRKAAEAIHEYIMG